MPIFNNNDIENERFLIVEILVMYVRHAVGLLCASIYPPTEVSTMQALKEI